MADGAHEPSRAPRSRVLPATRPAFHPAPPCERPGILPSEGAALSRFVTLIPPLTRRRFIATSVLLPFAAASVPSAHAAYTPIPRHSGPHLRTSLNAYSFSDLLFANARGADGIHEATKGYEPPSRRVLS